MQKIVFEDTTVVKSPYVTVDGIEYSITNGTYQGGTDLNADTFNTMQDNIENAIKKASITNQRLLSTDNLNNLYNELGIKVYQIWEDIPKNMPLGAYAYGTLIVITQSLSSMFLNTQIYITDDVHTASSSTTNRGVYVRTSQSNGWARLYGGNVGVTS